VGLGGVVTGGVVVAGGGVGLGVVGKPISIPGSRLHPVPKTKEKTMSRTAKYLVSRRIV
jgi:hypothetical protein